MKEHREVLLEEMTRPEIEQAMRCGVDTVLVIAGSIEQHGPHLPVGTDTMLGYDWGQKIAKALGNALVAPIIRPAISPHHMGFAGTITLRTSAFQDVVRDYVSCLAATGFKNVVLLCSHGGNIASVRELMPELQQKHHGKANVVAILDIEAKDRDLNEWLQSQAVTPAEAGVHAGLSETSCMMTLAPHLVDEAALEAGYTGDVDSAVLHERGMNHVSANGVLGDPRKSTATIGEELTRKTVEFYISEIKKRLAGQRAGTLKKEAQ